MEKSTKAILWVSGSLLAAVGIAYAIHSYRKAHPKEDKDSKNPKDEAEKSLYDTVGANETTLGTRITSDVLPFLIDRGNNRGGSEGLRVAQFQLMLNYAYGANLIVDGKMGQKVKEATNTNVPITIYPCNKATALFGTSICAITQPVWNYVLSDVIKKGGGSIAGFTTYLKSSSEFSNLARNKYKL